MTPELHQKLTAWRQHLHAHPELSLQEKATAAFVQDKLTELGIPFVSGIGGHGIVATLTRGHTQSRVGLRADMDALPITEDTGLPYGSKNPGVMHACGHDGHTASLLGAAALLAADTSWSGTVDFIFQPAEEGFGGSRAMVAAGLFDRFPMERVFGFHNWPGLAAGTIAVHDGVVMASGGRVSITIDGHAGHAGMPHLTRDPVMAAGHLIVVLQSIVSRSVDPLDTAVLSLCTIEGGTARNQIAGRVMIGGTLRYHRDAVKDTIVARIEAICAGIATSFGVKVTPEIVMGVGVVINTPTEAGLARLAADKVQAELRRDLAPSMAGEDFAFYLQHRPGAFVWIGNGALRDGAELHGPRYDFNDAILPVASSWMAEVAKSALVSNKSALASN
ncbi:amidohydrolase [Bradyrhizobium sp. 38]|uniref:amidohydrolase n=1 Tax=unclassified Bradyrhizobium TaxID=2631580 RepID=UPI001FFC0FE0|nr:MULTISPECIES: amidohydrolase [unclassified Bradyrhizobium]MCK1341200.1 amidohydrolase [Bradyrhizobium sp. 38]MCK1779400.1 amidohydrolase [Bradyrhizobium sp. 132]